MQACAAGAAETTDEVDTTQGPKLETPMEDTHSPGPLQIAAGAGPETLLPSPRIAAFPPLVDDALVSPRPSFPLLGDQPHLLASKDGLSPALQPETKPKKVGTCYYRPYNP